MAKTIGIDPGHGEWDPGAIGPTGLLEKDVALSISLKVAEILRSNGQKAILTRVRDQAVASVRGVRQELLARTYFLNAKKVDYTISIHINSSTNKSANYVSTFIQGRGGEAEKLANVVQGELVKATGWPDGGVRVQNLHMTRETNMPAILVECGFISNPEQEKKLRELNTRNNIARAIADGILQYLDIERSGDMDRVKVIVKDKEINGKLIDGQTYVPLRELIEILNNKIVWDGKSNVARVE